MSEQAYKNFEATIENAIRNVGVFSYLVEALVEYPVKQPTGPFAETQSLATHPYKQGEEGYDIRRRILFRQMNAPIFPPILYSAATNESFAVPVTPTGGAQGIAVNKERLLGIFMRKPELSDEVTGWALQILADNHLPPHSEPSGTSLPDAA